MWNFRIFEKLNLSHLEVPQKPKQPNDVINLFYVSFLYHMSEYG